MSDETSSNASGQTARRRLIKGAFGVPAVLTLSSGGNAAAASVTACVANAVTQNVQVAPAASGATGAAT